MVGGRAGCGWLDRGRTVDHARTNRSHARPHLQRGDRSGLEPRPRRATRWHRRSRTCRRSLDRPALPAVTTHKIDMLPVITPCCLGVLLVVTKL